MADLIRFHIEGTDLTLTMPVPPPLLGLHVQPANLTLLAAQDRLVVTDVPVNTDVPHATGSEALNFAVTHQIDVTFTHNLGRFVNASFINATGESAGVSLTHTPNTVRLQSNVPISGTLVCN